jgi:hypothetical protein
MESIRQPTSFYNRLIQTFRSIENYEYLYNLFYDNLVAMGISPIMAKYKLHNLRLEIVSFSSEYGYINDLLISDSIAMRAKLQGGLSLWDEIKRINMIFYQNRMSNYLIEDYQIVAQARPIIYDQPNNNYGVHIGDAPQSYQHINTSVAKTTVSRPVEQRIKQQLAENPLPDIDTGYNILFNHVPTDGRADSNEDYAMSMFISDSLQPEGYEYLNNMGVKYELIENQDAWQNKDGSKKYNDIKKVYKTGLEDDTMDFDFSLAIEGDDDMYAAGDAVDDSNENYRNEYNTLKVIRDQKKGSEYKVRTAEDLIYALMGENYVNSDIAIKNKDIKMDTGDSGTEFMRYKEIPQWQKLSREGVDTDISETLGFGMKETKNHVRGWDMDALRARNGENFSHFYGARNSSRN